MTPLPRHVEMGTPPYLQPENIVGEPVSGDIHGIPVLGSYGENWLIQSDFVPSGYVAVVASGGPNRLGNMMGFREHNNAAYRGLRQIPGAGPYPLVNSYSQRSVGVGVRQRDAAVCIQVTTNASYSKPTNDQIPV